MDNDQNSKKKKGVKKETTRTAKSSNIEVKLVPKEKEGSKKIKAAK